MTDFNADLPQVIIGAALGLGLAAAVGFRVFVPFLLVAIAAKSGQVHLAGGFEWLGTDAALVMFGLAALFEIAAYFIPYFDHLLDTVAGPAAVIAGTVLMASTLVDMAPWLKWAVALVAGGGTAGLLHGATSTMRLGSTATTGGVGNPIFATADGIVLACKTEKRGGKTVKLSHPLTGWVTVYCHLSEFEVKTGQKVKRGDVIGLIGQTGRARAPHVHYEVRKDGKRFNPWNFILDQ